MSIQSRCLCLRSLWVAVRSTGHIHCLVWIEKAPKMDMLARGVCSILGWVYHCTESRSLQAPWRPDARNSASLPFVSIANTEDQFAALLNRLQMHPLVLSPISCARLGADRMRCHFFLSLSRPCRDEAPCSKEVNSKKYMFCRGTLNQTAPVMTSNSKTGVPSYIGSTCQNLKRSSNRWGNRGRMIPLWLLGRPWLTCERVRLSPLRLGILWAAMSPTSSCPKIYNRCVGGRTCVSCY